MDKLTKVLLAAIAIGLWMVNATQIWQPVRAQPASAQQLHRIEIDTSSMALALTKIAVGLNEIVNGTCKNQKLCGSTSSQ
jgi:hypothetical protein